MASIPEARWYLEAGRPDEALRALRDADPTDAEVAYIRGRALADMGRYAEAESVARDALAREPQNVELLELLASVQLASNAHAAELTLRKALELDPQNAHLLALYVLILLQQDRIEWAERMLERVMRIAPDDAMTQRVRLLFLMRASGSGAARQAAEQFLRQYPDEAYAHYTQGLALLHRVWWRGLRHLRQAAALRPQDPLLAETVRVMTSWYMWPFHLTTGVVDYAIRTALAAAAFGLLFRDDEAFWYPLAGTAVYLGYKWTAFLSARAALERRVAKALRQMYGHVR